MHTDPNPNIPVFEFWDLGGKIKYNGGVILKQKELCRTIGRGSCVHVGPGRARARMSIVAHNGLQYVMDYKMTLSAVVFVPFNACKVYPSRWATEAGRQPNSKAQRLRQLNGIINQ